MKRYVLFLLTILVNAHAANLPEKLRVLSFDLSGLSMTAPGSLSQDLKKLLEKADPDVIILQRAVDWENCDRICKLRPGLQVVTCSSFAGPLGQVAILARDKAVLSWVEEIPGGQGFAFALLQAGSRKLGVFSAQTRDNSALTTERILTELKKLKQFTTNRADSFLIAGSSFPKSALTEAGFENIAAEVKPNAKKIASEFWVANAGFLSRPRAIAVAGIPQPVLISDVDSGSSYSSKFALQTPLLFAGETPPIQAAVAPPSVWQRIWPVALAVFGVVGALLALAYLVLRPRKNALALVPLRGPNGEMMQEPVLDDSARAGLIAWIKTAFMQRLISERRHMIAIENEATQRTIVIEEKLSQLQSALQDRISAYETRISRLETELTAATFENRDLIRSQIDLLKEKVAQAKEEFGYRRN